MRLFVPKPPEYGVGWAAGRIRQNDLDGTVTAARMEFPKDRMIFPTARDSKSKWKISMNRSKKSVGAGAQIVRDKMEWEQSDLDYLGDPSEWESGRMMAFVRRGAWIR